MQTRLGEAGRSSASSQWEVWLRVHMLTQTSVAHYSQPLLAKGIIRGNMVD